MRCRQNTEDVLSKIQMKLEVHETEVEFLRCVNCRWQQAARHAEDVQNKTKEWQRGRDACALTGLTVTSSPSQLSTGDTHCEHGCLVVLCELHARAADKICNCLESYCCGWASHGKLCVFKPYAFCVWGLVLIPIPSEGKDAGGGRGVMSVKGKRGRGHVFAP